MVVGRKGERAGDQFVVKIQILAFQKSFILLSYINSKATTSFQYNISVTYIEKNCARLPRDSKDLKTAKQRLPLNSLVGNPLSFGQTVILYLLDLHLGMLGTEPFNSN